MTTRQPVIEIGEDGEVLAMPFERLQGGGKLVVAPRLFGEKRLLIDPVVIGQAHHAFDRSGGFSGGIPARHHGFKNRQRQGYAGASQKCTSLQG